MCIHVLYMRLNMLSTCCNIYHHYDSPTFWRLTTRSLPIKPKGNPAQLEAPRGYLILLAMPYWPSTPITLTLYKIRATKTIRYVAQAVYLKKTSKIRII